MKDIVNGIKKRIKNAEDSITKSRILYSNLLITNAKMLNAKDKDDSEKIGKEFE